MRCTKQWASLQRKKQSVEILPESQVNLLNTDFKLPVINMFKIPKRNI